ncbi:MAG TPA: GNAT family N-acetyltransferase [Candidatus Aminicenantes bacterium]|nr:MAG: N-acetyltransferase [Candidatus Aminicenantes bacterium]HEK85400.1 GNAT family N-acetyltransferase [Candidatus Aminicenantes bacterium]
MLRPMVDADRQPVLDLIQATGFFTPDEVKVAEELIDIYLKNPTQKDYFIVVIENEKKEVVGYLTYGPTPLTEGTWDLYWIAISPREQGKGYGQKLVSFLEEEVQRLRGRLIIIETSSQPKYLPTRKFYEKLGYTEVARIPDFYRPGDDRVIFGKYFR